MNALNLLFIRGSMSYYEHVFIARPEVAPQQVENIVEDIKKIVSEDGGDTFYTEYWGLKKLAYPIQNKKSGFYHLFQYSVEPNAISDLEVEFTRDERFMRYLTVRLDKHAIEWAEKRREKLKTKA